MTHRQASETILITGAGLAEGPQLAQAFAAQGSAVALHDLTPIHVDRVVQQVLAGGGQARSYVDDSTSKIAVQTILEDVLADWGRIDGLVNNLRVRPRMPLLAMGEWDWRRTLDTNLGGPFLFMQSVARIMREQGGGVIVNVVGGQDTLDTPGQRSAYMASQLAMLSLTREAAAELAPYGIRVHAIGRSLTGFAMAAGMRLDVAMMAQGLEAIPRNRRADLPRLATWLCGEAAAGITGLLVDAPFL